MPGRTAVREGLLKDKAGQTKQGLVVTKRSLQDEPDSQMGVAEDSK